MLLGERHDVPEDHRWQLDVLAGLLARRARVQVGFEMFPRDEQPVLDAWSRGELSVEELSTRTRWRQAWGPSADSVLPLLYFTRRHHLPTLALNVPRALTARVARSGWASIPTAERAGVGDPAIPDAAYVDRLVATYAEHACRPASDVRDTPAAARFIEAQLLWDRAMAEVLARAARSSGDGLVVGLAGYGHLEDRGGIPRQLAALGIDDVVVLLPWDTTRACDGLRPGVADVVFGITPPAAEVPAPTRHACPPAAAAQPSRPSPRAPLPR